MAKGILSRLGLTLIAVVVAVEVLSLVKPLPAAQPELAYSTIITGQAPSLAWPASGQSALGAVGYGLLATNGQQKPAPTASVAKIITALTVLKHRPLQAGQAGPIITLGPDDVAKYQSVLSQDGSSVPVGNGEQITERQALEAMILPSANNMAYSLAVWAFGSLDNYLAAANSLVKGLGMTQTTVSDASGFDPHTVSTAQDLVKLAQAAMTDPVLTEIVGEPATTVPVAGQIENTNWLLGSDGIVGIKTGNTDQAGGCFLFAAKRVVSNVQVTLVGAVMGTPDLASAMTQARQLIRSADSGFALATIIKQGQLMGRYTTPWGDNVKITFPYNESLLVWQSQGFKVNSRLSPVNPGAAKGTDIGNIKVTVGQQVSNLPAKLDSSITKPSLAWRLLHPYL